MKPNMKKLAVCPDCGKPKMLFDSEKKAKSFIRYNGEEILRDGQTLDDLRIYLCPACCGYHISSHPYTPSYDTHTERMIDVANKMKGVDISLKQMKVKRIY